MMKRILAVGMLAAVVAASVQAQGTGLTAQGSNFTGPGGGGSGATATVGAYLPTSIPSVGVAPNGMPRGGGVASFPTATAPANVTIGSGANAVTVEIPAAAQQAAAGAIVSGNVTGFVQSLGSSVPTAQATALGNALAALGTQLASSANPSATLSTAIQAFNDAVNALPAGSAVPASLVAARALIAGYYGAR